jgi:hypothetical protein
MNSLLQDFFIKMDQQAQEPALSLVVTPPSSRSPTIGGPSSDFDRQYSLTESGSGESNVLLLTRSQAAMKRARDGMMGQHGMSLLVTDEVDDTEESEDRSSQSAKQSSGSGSFPIKPARRGAAMARSDDGVMTVGGGSLAKGLLGAGDTVSTRRKKLPNKDDDAAEGHYVGTNVDMEEEDDDDFECWSDEPTTSTSTMSTGAIIERHNSKAGDKQSTVSASSEAVTEEAEDTNFYGGFGAYQRLCAIKRDVCVTRRSNSSVCGDTLCSWRKLGFRLRQQ